MGFLVLALKGAYSLRAPGFTREFWEDEVHHSYPILVSSGLWDLRENLAPQLQPALDYVLRMVFWFPLFGHQEFGLRFPSLIYGLVGCVLAGVLAFAAARRGGLAPLVALAVSVPATIWATMHPVDIAYSSEARHYSLVALVSIVWCWLFFFRMRRDWAFWLGTAAFLNVHFFALTMVIPCLILEALLLPREERWRATIRYAKWGAVLVLLTVVLNLPAFKWLVRRPPGQVAAAFKWSEGLELWKTYGRIASESLPVWLWPFVLATGFGFAFSRRESRRTALILAGYLLAILPLVLIVIRMRSSYDFGARYFTPWHGLAWAALVLASVTLARAVSKFGGKSAIAGGFALALLTVTEPMAAFGRAVAAPMPSLPRGDFTDMARFYEHLKVSGKPILVLHQLCWAHDVPLMYLQKIGTPPAGPVEVVDAAGCLTLPQDVRPKAEAFLKAHPEATVLFIKKNGTCAECVRIISDRQDVQKILAEL